MYQAENRTLSCDMTRDCVREVTHIDRGGYVYCEAHGIQRRASEPCRKLRPAEVAKLARGEVLTKY
jgi:hypothetical protein